MPEPESFKLDIDGHSVEGTVCLPEQPGQSPIRCVLLCRNLVDHDPAIDQLWDAFIDRALEQSLAVVSFEPRCAHLILDDFDSYGLEDYWRDVERVLYFMDEHSRISTDPMAVIGYRLGSLAALRLAASHTGINRVCLVSPMLDGRNVSGRQARAVADTNGQAEGDRGNSPAHLPKRMLESLEEFDAMNLARACSAPVLLLHGAADRLATPEQSVGYDRDLRLAGLKVRLELVTRADHTFSRSETRHACIDRLSRFCTST